MMEMNQGNDHKSITMDYESVLIKQGQITGVYLKKKKKSFFTSSVVN